MKHPWRQGLLCLPLGAALACGAAPSGSGAGPEADAWAEAPAAARSGEVVETTRARRGDISRVVTTSGSIDALRSTAIGPAVPGRLIHVFVHVGDEVLFGAPLFQIDPGPYSIAMQEAEAGLAVARAEVDQATEEAARTRKLAAKQMVSAQDHRRAVTRVAVAKARLKQAEARVAGAKLDLNRTLVLMPYDGSVVERKAHEGLMATVRPNTHVVVVQESGALEAVLDVPEASHISVQPGDRVRLWVEESTEPLESEVRAVNRKIDSRTRTYAVRVPVSDPSGTIKAGAFVRAEITPEPRQAALLLDRSAVTRQEGEAFVFRVAAGRAERRAVRVGMVAPGDVEILSGLSEGDEVVVGEVITRLSDGSPVIPVNVASGGPRTATLSDDGNGEEASP
jgi:RND family efflux transporter MFP subunit